MTKIEDVSKRLYKRYSEIDLELSKRWSDPYANDPLVLERREILIKASVIVEVMGFKHLSDWASCKGEISQ